MRYQFVMKMNDPYPSLENARIRQSDVEISYDGHGNPYSAVARTILYHGEYNIRHETKIAFQIKDGVAFFEGFVEPDQVSVPHFKTVPAACEQVANVESVSDVESPLETIGRLFSTGQELPRTE